MSREPGADREANGYMLLVSSPATRGVARTSWNSGRESDGSRRSWHSTRAALLRSTLWKHLAGLTSKRTSTSPTSRSAPGFLLAAKTASAFSCRECDGFALCIKARLIGRCRRAARGCSAGRLCGRNEDRLPPKLLRPRLLQLAPHVPLRRGGRSVRRSPPLRTPVRTHTPLLHARRHVPLLAIAS